jgi:hypothetical protein
MFCAFRQRKKIPLMELQKIYFKSSKIKYRKQAISPINTSIKVGL